MYVDKDLQVNHAYVHLEFKSHKLNHLKYDIYERIF